MRDDMEGLTAIALQHETTLLRLNKAFNAALEQMRAMVAQHSHIIDRVTSWRSVE